MRHPRESDTMAVGAVCLLGAALLYGMVAALVRFL
jgi:hypothetical protein